MNQIIFADGTTFNLAETAKNPIQPMPIGREWRRFHIVGDYADVIAAFVDNASYVHSWESATEDGSEIIEQDLSEYSIAGEIIDLRDGTYMVYMGKPTENEVLRSLLETANRAISGEISAAEYAEIEAATDDLLTTKLSTRLEVADVVGGIDVVSRA